MKNNFAKCAAWYLVFAMFVLGIAPKSDASMAPSSIIVPTGSDRAADIGKIQNAIEMKMVRDRLDKLGFGPEDIRARIDNLSDHQIHQLALQIDDLRVGKDGALGVIVALLVIALLVIVILQLTGHKVVVTK